MTEINKTKQNGTVAVTGHSEHGTGGEIYGYKTYINCKKDIKTTISFYDLSQNKRKQKQIKLKTKQRRRGDKLKKMETQLKKKQQNQKLVS